ncbi:hypothetical protein IMZ48_42830, partial [Candidatus Bathyarchaeota archaeon]|nr:hypothetical protein [Candidatus Bathyarchaeota archaeon]
QHGLWDFDGMYWGQEGGGDPGGYSGYGMNQPPAAADYDSMPGHTAGTDAPYFLR